MYPQCPIHCIVQHLKQNKKNLTHNITTHVSFELDYLCPVLCSNDKKNNQYCIVSSFDYTRFCICQCSFNWFVCFQLSIHFTNVRLVSIAFWKTEFFLPTISTQLHDHFRKVARQVLRTKISFFDSLKNKIRILAVTCGPTTTVTLFITSLRWSKNTRWR